MKENVLDALMEDGELPRLREIEVERKPIPKFDVEELVEENSFPLKIIDILIILTAVVLILILVGLI